MPPDRSALDGLASNREERRHLKKYLRTDGKALIQTKIGEVLGVPAGQPDTQQPRKAGKRRKAKKNT